MQIQDAKKIAAVFPDVIEFISKNELIPELEVWLKNSIWGIGSRQTIYNALAVKSWPQATLGERIILFEAYQMMQRHNDQRPPVVTMATVT